MRLHLRTKMIPVGHRIYVYALNSENRPEWLSNVDKRLTAKRHESLMCMQNLKHFTTINYPAMGEVYRMVDRIFPRLR